MNANDQLNNKLNTALGKFNWALFLGLCVVALSIFFAGRTIANQAPPVIHGSFSGSVIGNAHFDDTSREFMTEWQAANFIGMMPEEFDGIIESGELSGTYTIFQVERLAWRHVHSGSTPTVGSGVSEVAAVPTPMEYDIVIADHRVFSRERLAEWLLARIDN